MLDTYEDTSFFCKYNFLSFGLISHLRLHENVSEFTFYGQIHKLIYYFNIFVLYLQLKDDIAIFILEAYFERGLLDDHDSPMAT